MKNPLEHIKLYKISYGRPKQCDMITISYTPGSSRVYAFHGYGEKILARVGGFGYDRMSTALLEAIEKLTGKNLNVNGAEGHQAVTDAARKQGINVVNII